MCIIIYKYVNSEEYVRNNNNNLCLSTNFNIYHQNETLTDAPVHCTLYALVYSLVMGKHFKETLTVFSAGLHIIRLRIISILKYDDHSKNLCHLKVKFQTSSNIYFAQSIAFKIQMYGRKCNNVVCNGYYHLMLKQPATNNYT